MTSKNVNNLLYAAKKYAVSGLVEQCLAFLESSLCAENACKILEQVFREILLYPVPQIRRGNNDDLGIISHISE